jgi:general secretion pathway protein J
VAVPVKPAGAHQKGVTLIEVLVALALMALLSIISWRGLDLTERSSARLNASADDTLALVRVLGQIESDISRHVDNAVLPATTQANSPAVTKTMLPPGIVWAKPVLTVARSAHPGAWQHVVWGQDGSTLRRAVGPAADVLPLPDAGPGEAVLEQVQDFTIRGWVPGQGWSALNSDSATPPATGLEIVIERRHQGVNETYRKVVLLP